MKKQILIASLVALSTASFAQQVITNKGDKLNVSDLKVEPWRVEGTSTQSTLNNQKIYQNNAVGIGDFTGTTMPAGTTLNIKPTGNIQMRFLSPTGASFSEYFLDGDYATRKAWFGFGSGTTPTLFTINNSIADGVINMDAATVGVKTPKPLTDFQVTGSGLVTGNLSINNALYGSIAPANDSYLNVGTVAGQTKAAARFSTNNCGTPCNQGVARNIVLNNFNATANRYASIAFVASGGNLAVDPAPATELAGIDRDPNNNYGGLAISTRDAAGYSTKLAVHASGRVDIANVGAASDNTLNKVLAVNDNGQIGYVDKTDVGSSLEPWQVVNSTTKATLNTQSIYQNGAIGIYNINPRAQLHINANGQTSGITTSRVNGMIITSANNSGYYLENVGATSGQRVLKNWMEEVTPGHSSLNWQVVTDDAQAVGRHLLKADLSNGYIGIGNAFLNSATMPTQSLDVTGTARLRNMAKGDDITAYPNALVAMADGTVGYDNRLTPVSNGQQIIQNQNYGPRDETGKFPLGAYQIAFPIYIKLRNTGLDAPAAQIGAYLTVMYRDGVFIDPQASTDRTTGIASTSVTVTGYGTNALAITHTFYNLSNTVNITLSTDNRIRVYTTTNNGYFRYTVNWVQ